MERREPFTDVCRELSKLISKVDEAKAGMEETKRRRSATQESLRESIPSFFMREIRVVRLRPMRAAAPLGPATRPLLSFKMRRIPSRSPASRVPGIGVAFPL